MKVQNKVKICYGLLDWIISVILYGKTYIAPKVQGWMVLISIRSRLTFGWRTKASRGPQGGGCEVSASATVSGKGKINMDQIKLSSPGWHKNEVIPLT